MGGTRTLVAVGLGAGLLAAGFGLGVLVSAGGPFPVPAVVPPAPAPPPTAPQEPPPPAPLPAEDRDALRALLDRIPEREVPSGTGVITGRVRTDEGIPLAGVAVDCTPEPGEARSPERTGGADADPVDIATLTYQRAKYRQRSLRGAVTDVAGEFRFEGLAEVRHGLEARKRGWQFQGKDFRSMHEALPGAVVEFVATPSVEVRLDLTWPGDTPPDDLQVQFRAGNATRGYGFDPRRPVVNVRPGTYDVQVVAGTSQELRSEPRNVEIPADGEPVVLRFDLRARPGVSGRILFADGEEFDQVQVLSHRLSRDQKADIAAFAATLDRGGGGGGGRSRERGRYSIPDLAPGRYAIGLARGWNLPVVAVEEVEVADAPVERDLRVPPLQAGEYVALTVLGPDGGILREYQVATGYRSKGSSSSGGSTVAMRPDGTRWVLHHASGGKEDPDAIHWIEVASPRYGTRRVEYRRGGEPSMTIRFEEPGRVDVRLDGYRGHSHEGRLRLALQSAAAETGRNLVVTRPDEARIGDDGTQAFLQVQPGEYVLLLQLTIDRMASTVAKVPVTVRGGRNDVAMKVPLLHTVTVLGAEGPVFARTREDPVFTMYARADAEGRAILDGLPEGEYEVRNGQKNLTVKVPAQAEVRF